MICVVHGTHEEAKLYRPFRSDVPSFFWSTVLARKMDAWKNLNQKRESEILPFSFSQASSPRIVEKASCKVRVVSFHVPRALWCLCGSPRLAVTQVRISVRLNLPFHSFWAFLPSFLGDDDLNRPPTEQIRRLS